MGFPGSGGYVSTSNQYVDPNNGTIVAWFNTTNPGAIIGFGNAQYGTTSSSFDRVLYIDANGDLNFGVDPASGPHAGTQSVVTSGSPVDDGTWHMAVATLGSGGQALYVDGKSVGTPTTSTTAANITGYWQLGEMPGTTAWPNEANAASGSDFNGNLGRIAVIPGQLTAAQVAGLYQAAGVNPPATVEPQNTCTSYDAAVQATGPASYLELNDNSPGNTTLADASGNFRTGSETGLSLTEGNTPGPLSCLNSQPQNPSAPALGTGGSGYVATNIYQTNPQNFTAEVWFTSYVQSGGLLSFDQQSGYNGGGNTGDDQLYIGPYGYLDWSSGGNFLTSANASTTTVVYDGQWHQGVVTVCQPSVCTAPQNAANFKAGIAPGTYLYLDGTLVNYSANYNTTNISGAWELGNLPGTYASLPDAPLTGLFKGYLGRTAVLPTVLSAQQVASSFNQAYVGLGGGGGGASALCLEDPASSQYNAAYPNCQPTASLANGSTPAQPATPLCSSAITTWNSAGGPAACVLAIAGGGGGGGYTTTLNGASFLVCATAGSGGGDGGLSSWKAAASTSPQGGTGKYIPGGNDTAQGDTSGGNDITQYYGAGGNGTYGVPVASGGGGGGFGGGLGGGSKSDCGGGGASSWYASTLPTSAGIAITPTANGPNTCINATTSDTSTNCQGFVDLTGPIAPPTTINLLATRPLPVGSTSWTSS